MNFFKILFLLAFVIVVSSCNFTENLNVNQDGSGDYALEMDGSTLMAMAGDKLGAEISKSNKKSIDSTITFKDLLKFKNDSIAKLSIEEQAALKKMENFVVNIKMDADKKELLVSMKMPFENVTELQDMMGSAEVLKALEKTKGKNEKTKALGGVFGNNNSKVIYEYNGKSFSRKVILDEVAHKAVSQDSTGMVKMMFASCNYTLKYHFPKAVKKVSNPDALFSSDRKTITIHYPFTEYLEHPEKMSFKVDF